MRLTVHEQLVSRLERLRRVCGAREHWLMTPEEGSGESVTRNSEQSRLRKP